MKYSHRIWLAIPPEEKDEATKAHPRFENGEYPIAWSSEQKLWYAKPGVELDNFERWRPQPQNLSMSSDDPISEFAQVLENAGLVLKELPVMDGAMHRVPTKSDKNGTKSGVYRGFLDGKPAGTYRDYRSAEKGMTKWVFSGGQDADPRTKLHLRAQAQQNREDSARALVMQYNKQAGYANRYVNSLQQATENAYLTRKGVQAAPGVRISAKQELVIPFSNGKGEIRSYQRIPVTGGKDARILKDSEKTGNWFTFGTPENGKPVLFAEGYSTAASIHEATGLPVLMTVDAGNMIDVAINARTVWPDSQFIFCADNDHQLKNQLTGEPENKGILSATRAAQLTNGEVITPAFTQTELEQNLTDFNDMALSRGKDAFRHLFNVQLHSMGIETPLNSAVQTREAFVEGGYIFTPVQETAMDNQESPDIAQASGKDTPHENIVSDQAEATPVEKNMPVQPPEPLADQEGGREPNKPDPAEPANEQNPELAEPEQPGPVAASDEQTPAPAESEQPEPVIAADEQNPAPAEPEQPEPVAAADQQNTAPTEQEPVAAVNEQNPSAAEPGQPEHAPAADEHNSTVAGSELASEPPVLPTSQEITENQNQADDWEQYEAMTMASSQQTQTSEEDASNAPEVAEEAVKQETTKTQSDKQGENADTTAASAEPDGFVFSNRPLVTPSQEVERMDPDGLLQRVTWEGKKTHVDYLLDGKPAFTDYSNRMSMASSETSANDEMVLAALLTAIRHYGGKLEITGSDAFKEKAISLIVEYDLKVSMSNPEQRAMLDEALSKHQSKHAADTIHASPLTPADLPPTPPAPERNSSPAQPPEAVAQKSASVEKEDNFSEGVKGRIIEHGAAPYQFDEANKESYFIKLQTRSGEKLVWGAELASAVRESRVSDGQVITLQHLGKKDVTVQKPVKDDTGKVIRYTPIQTHRNQWSITPAVKANVRPPSAPTTGESLSAYDMAMFNRIQTNMVAGLSSVNVPPIPAPADNLLWLRGDGRGTPESGDPETARRPQREKNVGYPVMSAWTEDGRLSMQLVKGHGPYLQGVALINDKYHHVLATMPGGEKGPGLIINAITDDGLKYVGQAYALNQSGGQPVVRDTLAFKLAGDTAPRLGKIDHPEKLPPQTHALLGFDERWRPDTDYPKFAPRAEQSHKAQPGMGRPGGHN